MAQSWAQAARLVRCTGFGATGAEVDAAVARTRADVVAALFQPAPVDPGVVATPAPVFEALPALGANPSTAEKRARSQARKDQQRTLLAWWLNRMLAADRPFIERLTLAWHGIFATAIDKVQISSYMLTQNESLRSGSTGGFRALALAMLTDSAMIFWLDNQTNTKGSPNENLAREFMELFALGHGDGYTEKDVKEGARALSGWSIDPVSGVASPDPSRHDDGVKTVLGVTGNLDHIGFCDAVLAQSKSAPFVLGRLWNELVSDSPMDQTTQQQAVAAYGSSRDIASGVAAMLASQGFDRAVGSRVLNPVEWTVGLARAVGVTPGVKAAAAMILSLKALGQVPFQPPSVGGWPGGQAWLSASSIDARWSNAHLLVALGHLDAVASAAPSSRIDAVAHLLGVATWSDRSAAALKPFAAVPADLVAAAAMTPEYCTV